jgi:hypothetical protein
MKKSSCGSKMNAAPNKKTMKPAMASKTMYNKKNKK